MEAAARLAADGALVSMVGGSTGDARGTQKNIVAAIKGSSGSASVDDAGDWRRALADCRRALQRLRDDCAPFFSWNNDGNHAVISSPTHGPERDLPIEAFRLADATLASVFCKTCASWVPSLESGPTITCKDCGRSV